MDYFSAALHVTNEKFSLDAGKINNDNMSSERLRHDCAS
jgi:hypothetical protein